ncbi:hypothetical protein DFH09DRAFT_1331806 [Mycena vulgaris]|nr:hypothetical protein DFH09DRAFT_1331806 [Mycena vulgaris]
MSIPTFQRPSTVYQSRGTAPNHHPASSQSKQYIQASVGPRCLSTNRCSLLAVCAAHAARSDRSRPHRCSLLPAAPLLAAPHAARCPRFSLIPALLAPRLPRCPRCPRPPPCSLPPAQKTLPAAGPGPALPGSGGSTLPSNAAPTPSLPCLLIPRYCWLSPASGTFASPR